MYAEPSHPEIGSILNVLPSHMGKETGQSESSSQIQYDPVIK